MMIERVVADILEKFGFTVFLERRLKEFHSNVDLVARKDNSILLVEIVHSADHLEDRIYECQGKASFLTLRAREVDEAFETTLLVVVTKSVDERARRVLEDLRLSTETSRNVVLVVPGLEECSSSQDVEELMSSQLARLFQRVRAKEREAPLQPLEALRQKVDDERIRRMVELYSKDGAEGLRRTVFKEEANED